MTLNIEIKTPPDPDLYFDIAGLPSPFDVIIPICISNNESITLYFRASLVNPPTDWVTSSVDLGSITGGNSSCFTATFSRNAPTLTNGEYSETLTLRIAAYTDSTYTTLYGYQDVQLTINYIDHTDPSWTILYQDNFDDGTRQGWTYDTTIIDSICGFKTNPQIVGTHYISAPYSAQIGYSTNGSAYKDYTVGAYTKAYIIIHVYITDRTAIKIGDTLVKPCTVGNITNQWLRLVYPLPTNATTRVRIANAVNVYSYIDDIIVIAK